MTVVKIGKRIRLTAAVSNSAYSFICRDTVNYIVPAGVIEIFCHLGINDGSCTNIRTVFVLSNFKTFGKHAVEVFNRFVILYYILVIAEFVYPFIVNIRALRVVLKREALTVINGIVIYGISAAPVLTGKISYLFAVLKVVIYISIVSLVLNLLLPGLYIFSAVQMKGSTNA